MPEQAGAVEDEPRDRKPDEEGNIKRFAEAAASALILDGVEELDELVGIPFAMASCEDAGRLLRGWRLGFRRRLGFGRGLGKKHRGFCL